ncbi:ABC transporter ATP-binding protein [Parasedimentitalea psychrophila]|uniref:ABC transporter ATP-binding protein n=1 Tax=Parasedimentitalea psychrophila TaxID=2997337 RepID=A0A9Y2KZS0_9RHOB|nr:ABC transporter ATP-binding protein [Parasedimentitalea psychrophila]WIY24742.1 ABC transporter ATP-binding protein [Parasedimentitalea psychrophila]
MSLLELSHVSAFYGSSQALFDVDLSIDEGQVLAVLGRNGMGKSTTVKVICRMLANRGGSVFFAGQDLANVPTHRAARLGLGLVPEGRRCFPNLTVYENLIASARPGAWDFSAIAKLFPRLEERRDQLSTSLSGGEQQMLAIGRALMTNPRLLILDEATEGLAPVVRTEIWAVISRLKNETDMAILVIDKSLKELGTVADTGVILEKGRSVWSGAFSDLTPQITDRYLGV